MTRVTTDSMTITIGGTDYSSYIDDVEESGGEPIYEKIKAWNDTYYTITTGYKDWTLSFNMLVDTNTKTLINGFETAATTYTVVIGESGVFQTTYTNMQIDKTSINMTAKEGLQMISFSMSAPGLRSNRTQA